MVASSATSGQNAGIDLTVPYDSFTLHNGLTVVVSEDHRTPLVNVRMWYHVGSQEGPYAHLFEHIFFGKTEHQDREYSDVLARVGVLEMEAHTDFDRTNYYETVSASALDAVLWMESDRMGYPHLTEEKLAQEIKNVRNERRQRENSAHLQIGEATTVCAYPPGHPYAAKWRETEEELESATLQKMREWHRAYYGAANTTLVVTGDITLGDVRQKAEKYFGEIRPGPPVPKIKAWIARRHETRRQHITADVSAPRLRMAWNIPPWGAAETDVLELVRRVLTEGVSARLHRQLVAQNGPAIKVEATLLAQEISSLFIVDATVYEASDLRRVEAVVREELNDFAEDGPSVEELQRAKAQHRLSIAKDLQERGHWSKGKSNVLARGQVFRGDPGHYHTMLRSGQDATIADVKRTVHEWLTSGALVLDVHPQIRFSACAGQSDRSAMPKVAPLPEPTFPKLTRRTLANGLDIILASHPGRTGLISTSLVMPGAGYAADPDRRSGTARLILALLEEGERSIRRDQRARLRILGAEMHVQGRMDAARLNLIGLRATFGASLRLFADIIKQATFPEDAVRAACRRLQTACREEATPPLVGPRFLPTLLYGEGHPYGRPFTGTGTAGSLGRIRQDDVEQFYRQHYRPENGTLVVAGDISAQETLHLICEAFSDWHVPAPPAPGAKRPNPRSVESAVYLMDQPRVTRSAIYAAQLIPQPNTLHERISIELLCHVLGAPDLQARLMANLREDKGWAYSAYLFGTVTGMLKVHGAEPIIAYAQVQTGKTAEAMQEIAKEWEAIGKKNGVAQREVRQAKKAMMLKVAGSLRDPRTVTDLIAELAVFGLPEGYHDARADVLNRLTATEVTDAARQVLKPDNLIWLVIGDKNKVEDSIQSLDGFGKVQIVETNELMSAG